MRLDLAGIGQPDSGEQDAAAGCLAPGFPESGSTVYCIPDECQLNYFMSTGMTFYFIIDVVIAYIIDLICGDPYWLPHPVRFIGWQIRQSEKVLRRVVACLLIRTESGAAAGATARKAWLERVAGIWLTIFVVSITYILVWLILQLASWCHPLLFHFVNIYFIYSALATKCLAVEAKKVYAALHSSDLQSARERLAMLVGRQTGQLDEAGVVRGAVETVAENTVDGVISPLFYALLGSLAGLGAPLVYAFKAVSTLDSMVGYMDEKYLYFGRCSARLDDAANYLPARITAILIAVSTLFCGKHFIKSLQVMWRDRRNHKSPNCGYPEAAVAGALGIRIGGANVYNGKREEKPYIGNPEKTLAASDIQAAITIMYITSFLALAGSVGTILVIIQWPR